MDHKIVDQLALIVFRSLLVTFSAYYLNTLLDYINHLIDKSFDSHQEYTIATDTLTTARGTKRLCKLLIFQTLYKVSFFVSPKFDHNLTTYFFRPSPTWTICPQNGLFGTSMVTKSPSSWHWSQFCSILRRSDEEPGRKAT